MCGHVFFTCFNWSRGLLCILNKWKTTITLLVCHDKETLLTTYNHYFSFLDLFRGLLCISNVQIVAVTSLIRNNKDRLLMMYDNSFYYI